MVFLNDEFYECGRIKEKKSLHFLSLSFLFPHCQQFFSEGAGLLQYSPYAALVIFNALQTEISFQLFDVSDGLLLGLGF
jgi:hypothetical protein